MIELTRRKMLSVTAAAVVGALASARATRPARANYINEINLQRIRNDPSFFKELWDTTYSVRESLGFDLGKEFLALNDHGYLAAFACVTAYDLTSYGNEPRIGPDYTLKELLAAPHLACDLYCVVTALLFRQVRPKSPERFWMAGWDHGAVGNHAQLFVEGVGLPLMLDPTIGAVAIADYNDVKAGRPVAPDKYRRLSSRKNEPFGDFPNKVKSAVEHGLYRPSDYLYFQDAEKYGRN